MFQIPANTTAMIGSLPYAEAADALQALERSPLGIPTWPQLPKRSFAEGMIAQYSEVFPGVKIDLQQNRLWVERNGGLLESMSAFYEKVVDENTQAFAISSTYAQGLQGFFAWLDALSDKPQIVKGQVVGPFTFGLGLNDNENKAVWFDEQYRDIVLKGLAKKALWQVEQLKKYAHEVVIFYDEPILSALGTPAYMGISDEEVISALNEVAGELQRAGAAVGVHCCGNMDWSLLAKTSIDIISFDAYEYGEKLALYPEAIQGFLERGGTLAWGIVPTSDGDIVAQTGKDQLLNKMQELKEAFVKKGVSRERLENQSILTPACGMGTLSAANAERVLDLLYRLSES